jgi:hypothetical protein
LAKKANNHFGIKCHKGWKGKTYHMDDDKKHECFRKYKDPEESYRDHSQFLLTRDRYDFLFLLEVTDYKSWARGLKKAGYATNPRYADLLIRIIEENELFLFDEEEAILQQPLAGTQYLMEEDTSYSIGSPVEPVQVGNGVNNREIWENNKVKFIYAREGDTWFSLAQEFEIYGWQIRKYNDLEKNDEIQPGETIYLERKRNKSSRENHVVRKGENMRNISQRYGVKLNVLYRRNALDRGKVVPPGSVIKLK